MAMTIAQASAERKSAAIQAASATSASASDDSHGLPRAGIDRQRRLAAAVVVTIPILAAFVLGLRFCRHAARLNAAGRVEVPAAIQPRCGAAPARRWRRGIWRGSRRRDRPAPRCAPRRPRRRPARSGICPASAGRITCVFDQAVVAGAALVGVAIALDQARAFGDFERELGGQRRRLRDQAEPALDLALLLGVAIACAGASAAASPASGSADSR